MSDRDKRLARELQALKACRYTVALEELRGLPVDLDRKAYVERVRQNRASGVLIDEEALPPAQEEAAP